MSLSSIPVTFADDILASTRSTGAISAHFQLIGSLQQLDDYLEKQKAENDKKIQEEASNLLLFSPTSETAKEAEAKQKLATRQRAKDFRALQTSKTHAPLRWILDARNSSAQPASARNFTALMICAAALSNIPDVTKAAQLLLERGASPNLASSVAQCPLLHICSSISYNGSNSSFTKESMARLLLEYGAHVDGKSPNASYLFRTPLHYAAERGNLAAICLLLEFGADLWMQDSQGMTPLMIALKNTRADAAVNLFEAMKNQCLTEIQEKYETGKNQVGLLVSSTSSSSGCKIENARLRRQKIQDEADELMMDKLLSLKNKCRQTAMDIAYSKRQRNSDAANTANRTQPAFSFIIDFHQKSIDQFREKLFRDETEKLASREKKKKEGKKPREEESGNNFFRRRKFFGRSDDVINTNNNDQASAEANPQQEAAATSAPETNSSPFLTPEQNAKIKSDVDKKVQQKFPRGDRTASANPAMLPFHLRPSGWQCFVKCVCDWRSSLPWISSFGLWIAYVLLRKQLFRRGLLPERWFSK